MAETYQELRKLPVAALIERHDKVAKDYSERTASEYLQEVGRRDQEGQTRVMLRYTGWITLMTVVMTIATVLNLLK